MTFDEYLVEIGHLALAEGCETPYTQQTGCECWEEAFNDGLPPAEAWAEEKSCGAYDLG